MVVVVYGREAALYCCHVSPPTWEAILQESVWREWRGEPARRPFTPKNLNQPKRPFQWTGTEIPQECAFQSVA